MTVYQNYIFLIEIFKAELIIRPEPYGSTPCRHITVVVLGVRDSVVHQCRVSETVGGRMIHLPINNSSGGQACVCCQEQGESLSLRLQLYRCALPPGAIHLVTILGQVLGLELETRVFEWAVPHWKPSECFKKTKKDTFVINVRSISGSKLSFRIGFSVLLCFSLALKCSLCYFVFFLYLEVTIKISTCIKSEICRKFHLH